MRYIHRIVLAGLLAATTLSVGAQTMKPGLWEISSKMIGGTGEMADAMAEMQKEMASMPPAERKQMEAMMAKHGASMGKPGAGMTLKICLTPDMIKQNQFNQQRGNCQHSTSPRVGNTLKFSMTCSNPTSSGEGVVTIISPEAYSTKMTLSTTQGGKTEVMKMESASRFLSADCGNIKPMVSQ